LLTSDLGSLTFDRSTQYFRLSVAQGVRAMLEQFRMRTVSRVQKLSHNLLVYLQANDTYEQPPQREVQQPVTIDTAACKYTVSVEMTLRGD